MTKTSRARYTLEFKQAAIPARGEILNDYRQGAGLYGMLLSRILSSDLLSATRYVT